MSMFSGRVGDQRGFTLFEMIIGIMLLSVLALLVTNFVVNWLGTASLAQARTALLSNAQAALDTVSHDIKLSGAADLNNRWPDANAPGGNQHGWQSSGSTIVLGRIAATASNDVIFSDPVQYVTEKDNVVYYVSDKKLYRRIIAADHPDTAAVSTCPPAIATASCPADRKVAEDVTAFSATYYDANDQIVAPDEARAVQLTITISQSKGGKDVDATYTTRMVFRND